MILLCPYLPSLNWIANQALYLDNMLSHQQPPDLQSAGSSDNNKCHMKVPVIIPAQPPRRSYQLNKEMVRIDTNVFFFHPELNQVTNWIPAPKSFYFHNFPHTSLLASCHSECEKELEVLCQ